MSNTEMKTAIFNRFELELPAQAARDCHHQGQCDEDVAYWAGYGRDAKPLIPRPESLTPELLAAELKEYGAWDEEELADDKANWRRIIWLAAGNIQEEETQAEK